MQNHALTEVQMLESLGGTALGAPIPQAYPWIGQASSRLEGGPAAIASCPGCSADTMDIDFSQPMGGLPNFDWLAPEASSARDTQGPGDAPGAAQGNEGNWGQQDEMALDRAIEGGSPTDKSQYDQIFSQFGQSQEGNCASVAVIKAALDKYEGKVFQEVKKSGDGYDIKMQDGKSVKVSKGELTRAAKAADLKGKPSEVKSMAILMFAAMAKRGSEEGMGNFDAVLKDMNNGFDPKKSAQLLGLGQKIKEVDPQSAGKNDAVVAWDNKHAVYVDEGKTDSYGQAKSFDGSNTRGGKLTKAIAFV